VKFVLETGGAGAFVGGRLGWALSSRYPSVRVDRIAGWAGLIGAAVGLMLVAAGA
jgi:hypothetical protein